MKYKIIALDLDGTLKNSQKQITKKTKDKLIELAKQGIKIVLASGRPTAGIFHEAKELELDKYGGYILSFNGARIINYKTGDVIYNDTYGKDLITSIYNQSKKYNLAILTYNGQDILTEDENDKYIIEESSINLMNTKHVESFLETVDFDVNKLLLTGEPDYLASIIDEFKAPYGDKLSIYRSAPFFIEVMGPGIDKAKSLSKLLEQLNLKREEMIAFGDGYNDLSMIEYAGFGVAMGNAVDEVKQCANYVTLSNDEDGIYDILIKLQDRGEI